MQTKKTIPALTLAAIGIVYGDIGTSPLYTVKEIFSPSHQLPLNTDSVLGVISMIVWALVMVVSIKYVLVLLRTDNQGEGGLLALTALATKANDRYPRFRQFLILLGVLGATLFYGDSVITPAISVIGAVEGLLVIESRLHEFVLPITTAIIICLFFLQRFGTAWIGRFFGPILVAWFLCLGLSGAWHVAQMPDILHALNPLYAWGFIQSQGWHLVIVMGAIVLALTGAEALYADMGHFGAKPIQLAWNGLVFPALVLNYLGQGALLLSQPAALSNPFFLLFPSYLLVPAVVLACLAAIIASQAVISGAFSLTRQAISLGFVPRLDIRFTSAQSMGQIYIPAINMGLMFGVLGVIWAFRSSNAMASAYGIAVTITMLISSMMLFFIVMRSTHPLRLFGLIMCGLFFMIDGLFVVGTSLKFIDGGWFPLALAGFLFFMMGTWWKGRLLMKESLISEAPLEPFVKGLELESLPICHRTAVYLVANPGVVPHALLHHLKHNQILHAQNLIVHVQFHDVPHIPFNERIKLNRISKHFWQVEIHFGFKQSPNVPKALSLCVEEGVDVELSEISYLLSRELLVPVHGSGMSTWREKIFVWMHKQTGDISSFFKLPENQVVELGTRVQI